MRKLISVILTLTFFAIMLYSGCKDTITSEQIDQVTIPSTNVSYSKYIQPVLNVKCATSGCHDNITGAGGVILTTYSNVMSSPDIVFPYHPETSHLVWSIDPSYGNVNIMPPLGSPYKPMTKNQVDGVKTWIKEGAKPN